MVKEYERLIAQKRFPGEDAIAKIPEYERGQLARTVYNGFYNAPDDVPRPYPKGADFMMRSLLLKNNWKIRIELRKCWRR